jgi:serine/threonine protein kinase
MFSERNASARVGEVIADKFRIEKLIGVGAMGAVYRAVHEWTQRTVAVKLLFDSPNAAESIERFFREARAATKIGHRNIVEVLDMGQHSDGTYYLVQELLEGETLRQRLDRLTKLSPTEALEALLPVMDALAAAHAAGIVHRDVKPENIYLHAERRTTRAAKSVSKLIDFGVAKAGNHPVRLTAAGVVLGTPNYMAPEQVDGASQVGPQADLWSIGVVLYECLSGERPFSGASVRDVFAKVTSQPAIPLGTLVPTLPEALVSVVHSAIERDRSVRFASMKAMLSALSSIEPLARAPSLAPMFESFSAPTVHSTPGDSRTVPDAIVVPAIKPALAAKPTATPTPKATPRATPTPNPSREVTEKGPAALDLGGTSSISSGQIALGAVMALALGAFGAFTIRGASRRAGASHADAATLDAPRAVAMPAARDVQRDASSPDTSATDARDEADASSRAQRASAVGPQLARPRPHSARDAGTSEPRRATLIE